MKHGTDERIALKVSPPDRRRRGGRAYVLLEVLLAMTIMAVSGAVIVQSMRLCLDHSLVAEGYTAAFYLTQSRMLELEMEHRGAMDAPLGRDAGNFEYLGRKEFLWESFVEYDRDRGAYHLKVTTYWPHKGSTLKFGLETLVEAGRINKDLLR